LHRSCVPLCNTRLFLSQTTAACMFKQSQAEPTLHQHLLAPPPFLEQHQPCAPADHHAASDGVLLGLGAVPPPPRGRATPCPHRPDLLPHHAQIVPPCPPANHHAAAAADPAQPGLVLLLQPLQLQAWPCTPHDTLGGLNTTSARLIEEPVHIGNECMHQRIPRLAVRLVGLTLPVRPAPAWIPERLGWWQQPPLP
jgi:hypothetical protein